MTSYSPRIYIYKITFEEVPYYYYGVKKEKYFNQKYWGSPTTHKWVWDFYTPKKQILEIFPYTDEGWIEAQEVETRLIKPFFNNDKWCLNESCGGKASLKVLRENGKISGKKAKELGVGVHGRTKEQMTEDGKKGGKIAGKKNKELGLGIHGLTPKQRSENGRRNGKNAYENKIGIHGRTREEMIENGRKGGKIGGKIGSKITNSQKWMCLETGYVSTAAGVVSYQKGRGIDTSKRKRVA